MSEVFNEVVELLYAGGGDELISKMEPTQSDVATHERKKRAITAGLSGIGAAAGAAGLGYAAHEFRGGVKEAKKAKPKIGTWKAVKTAAKNRKLATALVPLEVAGLGGELMATKILHGDTKKKNPAAITKKRDPADLMSQASDRADRGLDKLTKTPGGMTRSVITNPKVQRKGAEYTKKTAGALKRLPNKLKTHNEQFDKRLETRSRTESVVGHGVLGGALTGLPLAIKPGKRAAALAGAGIASGATYGALKPLTHPGGKAWSHSEKTKRKKIKKSDDVDVVWSGDFAKRDDDKQQVFGWASVIEVDGEPIVDLQGDIISAEEMEKAAYVYVQKSRKGGDMHLRKGLEPVHKSDMIESLVVTDEKREAMGLPDSVPTGWWVGFQVNDPEHWADIKSGKRTGFSIHGHGKRTPAGV